MTLHAQESYFLD